jgi:hypothetical protein
MKAVTTTAGQARDLMLVEMKISQSLDKRGAKLFFEGYAVAVKKAQQGI